MHALLQMEPIRTKTWKALAVFLNRQCFRRAWIVQEAALARSLVLVCGFEVLTWQDVLDVSIFLQASGWFHRLMRVFDEPGGIAIPPGWRPMLFASQQATCNFLPRYANLGRIIARPLPDGMTPTQLTTLLSSSASLGEDTVAKLYEFFITSARSFGSKDPRDKVFAPLALLRRMLAASPDFRLDAADLSKSATQIYTDTTSNLLQRRSELSLLSQVEIRASTAPPALPSWVPDFSQTAHGEFLGVPGLEYNTVPSRRKILMHISTFQSLELEGTCLDRIADFGPDFDETFKPLDPTVSVGDDEEPKSVLMWIKFCLQIPQTDLATGQDRVEALWRTLIGNHDGKVQPALGVETAEAFRQYLQVRTAQYIHGDYVNVDLLLYTHWHRWNAFNTLKTSSPAASTAIPSTAELAAFAETWRQIFVAGFSRLGEVKELCGPADVYGLALGRVYGRRRLFTPAVGLIGLAPASAAVGDQIWFISGARVPFILRPSASERQGRTFTLVGETYVHGLMHGEIMQWIPPPKFERFVIV